MPYIDMQALQNFLIFCVLNCCFSKDDFFLIELTYANYDTCLRNFVLPSKYLMNSATLIEKVQNFQFSIITFYFLFLITYSGLFLMRLRVRRISGQ